VFPAVSKSSAFSGAVGHWSGAVTEGRGGTIALAVEGSEGTASNSGTIVSQPTNARGARTSGPLEVSSGPAASGNSGYVRLDLRAATNGRGGAASSTAGSGTSGHGGVMPFDGERGNVFAGGSGPLASSDGIASSSSVDPIRPTNTGGTGTSGTLVFSAVSKSSVFSGAVGHWPGAVTEGRGGTIALAVEGSEGTASNSGMIMIRPTNARGARTSGPLEVSSDPAASGKSGYVRLDLRAATNGRGGEASLTAGSGTAKDFVGHDFLQEHLAKCELTKQQFALQRSRHPDFLRHALYLITWKIRMAMSVVLSYIQWAVALTWQSMGPALDGAFLTLTGTNLLLSLAQVDLSGGNARIRYNVNVAAACVGLCVGGGEAMWKILHPGPAQRRRHLRSERNDKPRMKRRKTTEAGTISKYQGRTLDHVWASFDPPTLNR